MEADALLTVAEIAAAFAGFGALAGLIRQSQRGAAQVLGIVRTSLSALLFAMLPVVADKAGLSPARSLQISAALVFPLWSALWIHAALETRRVLRVEPDARPDLPIVILIFLINFSGSLLSATLALGFGSTSAEALYLALVLCPLTTAGLLLSNVLRMLAAR